MMPPGHLKHAKIEPLLRKAATATIGKPSSDHEQFTCTIYSLETKETWKHGEDRKYPPDLVLNPKNVSSPKETITLPGVPVQDTAGFVEKGPAKKKPMTPHETRPLIVSRLSTCLQGRLRPHLPRWQGHGDPSLDLSCPGLRH